MAIIIDDIIVVEGFILNAFGERFKNIRLSKRLTQEQIANEFNGLYGYAFTVKMDNKITDLKELEENIVNLLKP